MLDAWRASKGYREIARDLGCSAGVLTTWKQGRVPVKTYLEKLESLANVPPIAWQWWICVDPSKAAVLDEKGPMTLDKARMALDYLLTRADRRDLWDFEAGIRICITLLEQRPAFVRVDEICAPECAPPYVPHELRAIDALLDRVGWYVRDLLHDRHIDNERARPKNAA